MPRKKQKGSRTQKVGYKPKRVNHKMIYRKAGKLHRVSYSRDAKIKAERTRKKGEPSYTGDLKGSWI